jgi:ribonuclease HI
LLKTVTNQMDTIALLKEYAEGDVGSVEKTLALVAARWIAAEPSAAQDPLLTELLGRARLWRATHEGADAFLFAQLPTRRTTILDFFGCSASGSSTKAIPTPTPVTIGSQRYFIYCDGACQANGRRGARAGYGGVLQAPDGRELETVSEALATHESQTNQRAELRALQWAFTKAAEVAAKDKTATTEIHTDSEYAMKCFTEWGAGWAAKGWRKAGGDPVLHQDIIRPMWEMWKMRGSTMRLHHVAAHTGARDRHSKGNARADALAVASLH